MIRYFTLVILGGVSTQKKLNNYELMAIILESLACEFLELYSKCSLKIVV